MQAFSDRSTPIEHGQYVMDKFALKLAAPNAVMSITTLCAEFNKIVLVQCISETAGQFYLKSKASDCTLQEFRQLASACMNSPSFSCEVLPSEYYMHFV